MSTRTSRTRPEEHSHSPLQHARRNGLSSAERRSHEAQPEPATPTGERPSPPAVRSEHRHAWATESSHPTSEGLVSYVRCSRCGGRRVELRPLGTDTAPLSGTVRRVRRQRGERGERGERES